MVSIKNLLFISLLVLFCLAEIVPEEAAPAEAIESADESHADEGSDQESTEAAAEQIASDATENQEGAVDSLSDEGKIGSSIFGGGYRHHSFFRGGRRFKFHRYRNRRIASPIEIQIRDNNLYLHPCGCYAPLRYSHPWWTCGAWQNIGGCSQQIILIIQNFKRKFTIRGPDNAPQCVSSDNKEFLGQAHA